MYNQFPLSLSLSLSPPPTYNILKISLVNNLLKVRLDRIYSWYYAYPLTYTLYTHSPLFHSMDWMSWSYGSGHDCLNISTADTWGNDDVISLHMHVHYGDSIPIPCTYIYTQCVVFPLLMFLCTLPRGFTFYKMANLDNRISNADQILTQVGIQCTMHDSSVVYRQTPLSLHAACCRMLKSSPRHWESSTQTFSRYALK